MLFASWRLERSGREIRFESERQETRAEAQRREGLYLSYNPADFPIAEPAASLPSKASADKSEGAAGNDAGPACC
jgi:hypothetical protein